MKLSKTIFKKEQRWLILLALLTLIALFTVAPTAQASHSSYQECPPPYDQASYGSPLDLSGCYLNYFDYGAHSSINLTYANISDASMWDSTLIGADLTGANLSNTYLIGADLSNAVLRYARLYLTTLVRANLSGANLSGADLTRAILYQANLSGANLRGAILEDADLTQAVLSGANLSGAILDQANLTDANLTNADLTNADLTGANIRRTNFSGVTWSNTLCPDGETYSSDNTPETCFPPVITSSISGTLGDNGWYISDVTVGFTCVINDGSGVATDTVAGATLSSEGSGQSVTNSGECIDNTGSTASSVTVSGINIDKTAPTASATVSVAPNANGWHNSDVTVSFSGSDALSGIASCSSDVILSIEGSGLSASGTCTDNAGNISPSATASGINIDKTAPVITPNVSGTMGDNGWYVDDVTVSFTCVDEAGGSGIDTNTVAGTNLTSEGAGQSVTNTGECTDNAGNTASSVTVSINIDKTAPTVSATVSPAANANGWHNSDVTVTINGSDSLSGIATCGPNTIFTSEGTGFYNSGTCIDNAGNVSAIATASGINIDKTAPVVSVTGVTNGATYTLGAVPTAGCDTQDTLSGVATSAFLGLSGANPDGSGTITATCVGALDYAGNFSSASVTYTVLTPQEATANIQDDIAGLVDDGVLKNGQASGLTQSLNNAIRSLDKGKTADACNQLTDFIAEVNAKTPSPLDAATAADLIADAQAIQTAIGCP